jgi:hypothetical protein
MPPTTPITASQLGRLICVSQGPAIVDVRIDDHYRAAPRLLPGSLHRDHHTVSQWAAEYGADRLWAYARRGRR